jgi:glucose-6-phosphate-specific signal transduction histidine kinase
LAGMQERIRALGGSFELFRKDARTIIRCHLPIRTASLRNSEGQELYQRP